MKFSIILKIAEKIEDWLMIVALSYMGCVIFFQVIMRYIFKTPFSWPEETARFFQIWLIYLGVSACVREGKHIHIGLLIDNIKNTLLREIVEKIASLITLSFLILVFYLGVLLVIDFVHYKQTSPALGIPMYFVALSIPLGIGLSVLRYLGNIFEIEGHKSTK
ncbi:MAG: TRAP transporter small permease [Candidatus Heimdallarchaeaceae archaeon]